jgi:hypothetical protein
MSQLRPESTRDGTHCPTCGSRVQIATTDEGTSYYLPMMPTMVPMKDRPVVGCLSEPEMRKVASAISVQASREPAIGTIPYMVAERLALATVEALPGQPKGAASVEVERLRGAILDVALTPDSDSGARLNKARRYLAEVAEAEPPTDSGAVR